MLRLGPRRRRTRPPVPRLGPDHRTGEHMSPDLAGLPPPPPRPRLASGAPLAARVAVALGLVLLGLWTLHGFLPALAWAVILAIAMWPLYRRARRRIPVHGHGILLPALFATAIALLFLLPLGLLAIQAGREAGALLHWATEAERTGLPAPDWLATLPFLGAQASAWWQENLADPGGAKEMLARLNNAELLETGRQLGANLAHRAVLFGFTILTL